MTIDVRCLCGDVTLEVSGEPMAQVFCHCGSCQAAHGGAYAKVAMYPAEAIRIVRGDTVNWTISRTPRVTCPRCGTRLYQEPPGFPVKGLNAYLLPAGKFVPAWHQQCADAVMPVRDDLPHYWGYPAAIGGSDETVSW